MNIVFDFGSVLLRWRPRVLLRQTLPHLATDEAATDALQQAIFQGFGGDWAEFDRGTVEVPELVRRIAARSGLAPHEVRSVIDALPAELQPLPECVAVLPRLRERGHRLYYLSNMPVPVAEHIERSHGFMAHFDDGIFSGRVRLIKPEPAIFEHAQQRFGLAPAHTLFLDDHPANVAAAQAAGWLSALVREPADVARHLREHRLLDGA